MATADWSFRTADGQGYVGARALELRTTVGGGLYAKLRHVTAAETRGTRFRRLAKLAFGVAGSVPIATLLSGGDPFSSTTVAAAGAVALVAVAATGWAFYRSQRPTEITYATVAFATVDPDARELELFFRDSAPDDRKTIDLATSEDARIAADLLELRGVRVQTDD